MTSWHLHGGLDCIHDAASWYTPLPSTGHNCYVEQSFRSVQLKSEAEQHSAGHFVNITWADNFVQSLGIVKQALSRSRMKKNDYELSIQISRSRCQKRSPGRPKGSKDTKPRKKKICSTSGFEKQSSRMKSVSSPAQDLDGSSQQSGKGLNAGQPRSLSFVENLQALAERRAQAAALFASAKENAVFRSYSSPEPPSPRSSRTASIQEADALDLRLPAASAAVAVTSVPCGSQPETGVGTREDSPDPFHSDWKYW